MRPIARVRIGTRGSQLALAQARSLQSQLSARHPGEEFEIVTIRTSGDRGDRDRRGAFVREIQDALRNEAVDLGLHCLKDLPTDPVPGLRISAYLEREDPRDALISRGGGLEDLPAGAVVGTGSLRRTSQLAARRPDLTFRPLVGNVDTRLRKLIDGEYEAIVLAMAGLRRLGVLDDWNEGDYRRLAVRPLEPDVMLPAPGQAVLVVETRSQDSAAHDLVRHLNDPSTEVTAIAERSFLRAFGGGCSVPVAALAVVREGRVALEGLVASPDGRRVLRGRDDLPADISRIEATAAGLAASLGEQGAYEIVAAVARREDA